MSRDFWLVSLKNFDEETDTQFLISDQVYEPQSGAVSESFKEQFYVVTLVCHELMWDVKTVILFTICDVRLFLRFRLFNTEIAFVSIRFLRQNFRLESGQLTHIVGDLRMRLDIYVRPLLG